MAAKKIKVPSFDVDVYSSIVYVCSTKAEVDEVLDALGAEVEEHSSSNVGLSIEVTSESAGCAWHILAVYDKSLDTLAHEASHIADMILKRKGVENVDTEVRAYLMGFIVGKAGGLLRGMKWPKRRA